jgi:hypothetical protein
MEIPGEPEIGANFKGAMPSILHPVQFPKAESTEQPTTETTAPQQKSPQELAKRAKGIPLEDQLHHARDLALSGHAVQQYQPRGLTNTAIRTA